MTRKEYLLTQIQDFGRRIFGVFPAQYPREILWAHNILPVEIWDPPLPLETAKAHLQPYICSVVQAGLELVLSGKAAFLDGLLFPHTCDSIQNAGLFDQRPPEPEHPLLLFPASPGALPGVGAQVTTWPSSRPWDAALEAACGPFPPGETGQDGGAEQACLRPVAPSLSAPGKRAVWKLSNLEFYQTVRRGEYMWPDDFITEFGKRSWERAPASQAGIKPGGHPQRGPARAFGIAGVPGPARCGRHRRRPSCPVPGGYCPRPPLRSTTPGPRCPQDYFGPAAPVPPRTPPSRTGCGIWWNWPKRAWPGALSSTSSSSANRSCSTCPTCGPGSGTGASPSLVVETEGQPAPYRGPADQGRGFPGDDRMSLAAKLRYGFHEGPGRAPADEPAGQAQGGQEKAAQGQSPVRPAATVFRAAQGEIMTRHYFLARFRARGPGPWPGSAPGAPVELLRAFDFYTVYPENHGGPVRGPSAWAPEICRAAEDQGYHQDLCFLRPGWTWATPCQARTPVGKTAPAGRTVSVPTTSARP